MVFFSVSVICWNVLIFRHFKVSESFSSIVCFKMASLILIGLISGNCSGKKVEWIGDVTQSSKHATFQSFEIKVSVFLNTSKLRMSSGDYFIFLENERKIIC